MKRGFDFIVALCALTVLSPLLLWIGFRVRRATPGGALFIQTRVGRGEKPFACLKFRTMYDGAPNAGSHEVPARWITPIGHWLRRYKFDELPQLFNVLRGDMSLVGPRPCLVDQRDVIAARRALNVFEVRPGITGPAQLAAIDMSSPDILARVDRQYIETRSFLRDLAIIFATLMGRGSGDAVAR